MEHDVQGEGGQTLQAVSQDDGSVKVQVSHGVMTLSAVDAGALGAALQEHAKAQEKASPAEEPAAEAPPPAAEPAAPNGE
jgi:hypothetical protein